MRRLVVCAVVFAFLVAASLGSLLALRDCTVKLEQCIDRCAAACESDDPRLPERIDELKSCWADYYRRCSFLTRSASLEELAVSVSRLSYLPENRGGDFESELNAIKFRARTIYDGQLPLPRSVF